MAEEKMVALCGLKCSGCAAYLATQQNNNEAKEKAAREWTERFKAKGYDRPPLKAEDITCFGCLSDGPIYLYCRTCSVRQCGLSKRLSSCTECPDFKSCALIAKRLKHNW